jgi:transposase
VYSVDEKCGMQALERAAADLPLAPKHLRRRECNYIRHGTQTLIAALHVATGHLSASVSQTRTEQDFEDFVKWIVTNLDPDEKAVFILDQLNTHKSENLVRLVAKINDDQQDLGSKGKQGILKSMVSRMEYLEGNYPGVVSEQKRRLRIVYTPKHCSWLNVVEGWFSGLQCRLLNLLSCKSTEMLADQVLEYVNYYNQKWAKVINWSKVTKSDIDILIAKTKSLVTKLSG